MRSAVRRRLVKATALTTAVLVALAAPSPGIAGAAPPGSEGAVVATGDGPAGTAPDDGGVPVDPSWAPPEADLPSGFLDGVPVGGDDIVAEVDEPAVATPSMGTRSGAGTRAVTRRYFGQGPWQAIQGAAAQAARPCTISNDGVVALMVAPIFKESSAATSASTSPSPMTLSRADEWNGVRADTSNRNANYGLYENRDPYTPYQRAYWHPGIGIWQYDSAGVGAPYTAVERMDVNIVGADVAKGMISRYCAKSGTGFEKRRAAWSPWGTACTTSNAASNLCEIEFQAMTGGSTNFSNISLVPGVTALGGAVARTCRIGGQTLSCWYVDPARSEGATGWKFNPSGGPSPTASPTPLALPFYVLSRNGREERHWLKADTGYPVDISGTRQLGKNARPRTGTANVGSGVTWSRTSTLCDVTANRGTCGGVTEQPSGPAPPSGISGSNLSVSGDYRAIRLDVDGNGHDDIFWYAPGTAADYLWRNQGNGRFTSTRVDANGTYDHVMPIDVDGDRREDLLWYASDTGRAYLWRSLGNGTFTSVAFTIGVGFQPFAMDLGGQGKQSLFVYGPGAKAEAWWNWNGTTMVRSAAAQVSGTYQPFVGDFDGNRRDDIFWYAPGSAADYVWLHRAAGGYLNLAKPIAAAYQPLVGDYDGDGKDDIVWYQAGSTTEQIWWGAANGAFVTGTFTVNATYVPTVADLEGDGRDDVLWYDPTSSVEHLWTRWSAGRGRGSVEPDWVGGYRLISGSYGPGGGGVFWYGPGVLPDALWWN